MSESSPETHSANRDPVDEALLDKWSNDPQGPVALHLKQNLKPVSQVLDEEAVLYPPTYADIGYNIDTLSDGTQVALIDSVGSQANRMEPLFKSAPLADFVPQIRIVLTRSKKEVREGLPTEERQSIFDLAHRSADAVVQSCPTLATQAAAAFRELRYEGDASRLCAIAPTSLLFGVWDSRGGSGEKRPRLVRSIIRAWNVDRLHAAAQFNSVWKTLEESQQEELEKEAAKRKVKLSEKGLKDSPAVFRKTKVPQYGKDGLPNLDARVLGGVVAHGPITREVTVNLVALRALKGGRASTEAIRKYLLGLVLMVATTESDLFLREGCHLRYGDEDRWYAVPRRGEPAPVDLAAPDVRQMLASYTASPLEELKSLWPESLEHHFNLNEAKKLVSVR